MFSKILIANRGEIACRIIKTAKRLGIRTVAVYSDADASALHVELADEGVHIGPAPSAESYLVIDAIIEAATRTGAEAIHPGYGFLSENPAFSRACDGNGLVFIGPPTGAIEAMGSKSAAKAIMQEAGVPLVPGYHGDDQDPELLKNEADSIGYPVLIKAAAGGGGKGMRQVYQSQDFMTALQSTKREASKSFGNDKMLIEKYLQQPRHVEIQVFCDNHGNALHLFERDCSVQRRHQKVLEEAPAPGMTEHLRDQMGLTALEAAKAINYRGAGTVEFLLDTDGAFYFMEMNTRLQVEHPVTELITGQDLVEWQLRVASGEQLPVQQDELNINGHAFEARIYAEDPDNDFLPQSGTIEFLHTPTENENVRIDSGVRQGDEISVHYDPMVAKLIVWDSDREAALNQLIRALEDFQTGGVKTNTRFVHALVCTAAFRNAGLSTRFIEQNRDDIFSPAASALNENNALPLAALYLIKRQEQRSAVQAGISGDPESPWHDPYTWRLNESATHQFAICINHNDVDIAATVLSSARGKQFRIQSGDQQYLVYGTLQGSELSANIDGHQYRARVAELKAGYRLFLGGHETDFCLTLPDTGEETDTVAGSGLTAPMTGTIVTHAVQAGDTVHQGDLILVMEAMKMEHSITAPHDGTVKAFHYQVGELAEGGSELIDFEVADS